MAPIRSSNWMQPLSFFSFLDQAKCDAAFQSLQADGIAVEYNDMIDAYEKRQMPWIRKLPS